MRWRSPRAPEGEDQTLRSGLGGDLRSGLLSATVSLNLMTIGLIYADNGRRASSIRDVELMELATAQVGLAFENELLRRQLDQVAVNARN